MSETKIIATIGPVSEEFRILKLMFSYGMNIARINTKYGSREQYLKITNNLHKIGKVEIMYDFVDIKILDWLKSQDFEYLAVAFAESSKQIKRIRQLIFPKKVKIIAKIESKKGIKNLKEIIDVSDGLMVARGDLGEHIPLAQLPLFQKLIIKESIEKKKFVITATEMLLSMTNSKIPTRAEVCDVANAVLDGSNAVMLSEETAIGKYPALAVKMMKEIVEATERGKKKLGLSDSFTK